MFVIGACLAMYADYVVIIAIQASNTLNESFHFSASIDISKKV